MFLGRQGKTRRHRGKDQELAFGEGPGEKQQVARRQKGGQD